MNPENLFTRIKELTFNVNSFLTEYLKIAFTIVLVFMSGYICSAQTSPDSAKKQKQANELKVDSSNKRSNLKVHKANDSKIDTSSTITEKQLIKTYQYTFTTGNWFVYIIGGVLCILLLIIIIVSPKNGQFALGLPDGSVRAIIAILAIILYVLISLTLSAIPQASTIASDATKTLGTLVVAISAFYFGSKTIEQGIKAGTAAVQALNDSNCDPTVVPVDIIKNAIGKNKNDWATLYGATNILLGKKKIQDTIQDIDCIVFKVDQKLEGTGFTPIPAFINYVSGGKSYKIPTDVQ